MILMPFSGGGMPCIGRGLLALANNVDRAWLLFHLRIEQRRDWRYSVEGKNILDHRGTISTMTQVGNCLVFVRNEGFIAVESNV